MRLFFTSIQQPRTLSNRGDYSLLNEHSSFDICLMDINNSIVQDDQVSLFIDSGAMRHACKNKYFLKPCTRWLIGILATWETNLLSRSMERGMLNLCLRRESS